MALGVFFPFSKSRHRLAIPSSDAQPSTPFGCPAIQGAPRNPVRERSRHGPILYYVWRLSRASACQKFRRVQGETQPREAKRRPRMVGTRAKLPIMALPGCEMGNRHPDSGSAGCRSDPDPLLGVGQDVKQADPQQPRTCNTHVECLPHERCLKGLERLERGSLTRPTAGAEGRQDSIFASHGSMTSEVHGRATNCLTREKEGSCKSRRFSPAV